MTSRLTLVPASYVLLLRGTGADTEVLLQQRANTGYRDGYWAIAAAGHIEAGETAVEAAHREAAEELAVTDLELEFLTAMQRTGNDLPIDERIDFFFAARSWQGEPRIVEPEKCSGLGWFALEELPDPVVPPERELLRQLQTGTLTPYSTFGFRSGA